MYEIRMWAFGISAVCVISCLLKLVAPSIGKSSPVMIAVNLFIILNIIYPISSRYVGSFVIEQSVMSQTFDTNSVYETEIIKSIKKITYDKLSSLGINAQGILIDISVEQQQVKIDKITVQLSEDDMGKSKYIKEQLDKYLGITVQIQQYKERTEDEGDRPKE